MKLIWVLVLFCPIMEGHFCHRDNLSSLWDGDNGRSVTEALNHLQHYQSSPGRHLSGFLVQNKQQPSGKWSLSIKAEEANYLATLMDLFKYKKYSLGNSCLSSTSHPQLQDFFISFFPHPQDDIMTSGNLRQFWADSNAGKAHLFRDWIIATTPWYKV